MKDKLISASALVEALNAMEWKVTGLGQKMAEKQFRELIEEAEEVDAIPVEYIEGKRERAYQRLENIMQNNGEEYLRGEYARRLREKRVVLGILLAEWEHEKAQEVEEE